MIVSARAMVASGVHRNLVRHPISYEHITSPDPFPQPSPRVEIVEVLDEDVVIELDDADWDVHTRQTSPGDPEIFTRATRPAA